ncbi:MAG: ATP-grasp domain-containing protein [Pseudomonadota bacterium]
MTEKARPTVLLTTGRVPPAVDLARSFAANGWRVVVADPLPVHLAATSRSVAKRIRVPAPAHNADGFAIAIRRIVHDESVRLIVPVSEETLWVTRLAPTLPDTVTVFAPEFETALALHAKGSFINVAQSLGLTVPETAMNQDAANSLGATSDIVIKPNRGIGGADLQFVDQGQAFALPSAAVAQKRIFGEEVSACAIAHHGQLAALGIYAGVVRQGRSAVAFRRIESEAVTAWVAAFVELTNHHGLVSFDFIVDASGQAYAIECNPRATSGLHFIALNDIAIAITDGDVAKPRDADYQQEFWSCWTEWFARLRQPIARKQAAHALRHARDISWSWRDPMVFWLATMSCAPTLWRAARQRRSFAEVITQDFEWHS